MFTNTTLDDVRSVLSVSASGDVYTASNNAFTGTNTFTAPVSFTELNIGLLNPTNISANVIQDSNIVDGVISTNKLDATAYAFAASGGSSLPEGQLIGSELISDGTDSFWRIQTMRSGIVRNLWVLLRRVAGREAER